MQQQRYQAIRYVGNRPIILCGGLPVGVAEQLLYSNEIDVESKQIIDDDTDGTDHVGHRRHLGYDRAWWCSHAVCVHDRVTWQDSRSYR